jgi:hypothetical protein
MTSIDPRKNTFNEVVRTSGRSMAPLIPNHSVVRLVPASPGDIVPGEIIVFRREGKLFAHRLIDARGTGDSAELREKGDNCLRATWIPGTSLLGRAVELRSGHSNRSLNGDPRRSRVRGLTWLSRLEADIIERYVNLKSRTGMASLLKWVMLIPAALAAPFRFLLLRALLTVYPRQELIESGPALHYVLGLFRSLFLPPEHKPNRGLQIEDWNTALEMAGAHGLLPLIPPAPEVAGGIPTPPPQALEQLRKQRYRIALSHNLALEALLKIAHALTAAAVPYAVLKGPFLYEWLYRELFPREYEDIDILVSREMVTRAVDALHSAGYQSTSGRLGRAFMRIGHFHLALHSPRPGWPPVELHWSLLDRGNLYRIPDEECLARIRPFGTGASSFTVLAIEDQLIYLCLHAAKHGAINAIGLRQKRDAAWFCRPNVGNRLLWFADIALLLRKSPSDINWAILRERTAAWNVHTDVVECMRVLELVAPDSPARETIHRLGEDTPPGPLAMPENPAPTRRPGPDRILDWAMRMNPALNIRPIRILLLGRLLFPSPRRLLAYYQFRTPWILPWLYLFHPAHIIGKLLNLHS